MLGILWPDPLCLFLSCTCYIPVHLTLNIGLEIGRDCENPTPYLGKAARDTIRRVTGVTGVTGPINTAI
jgi:hypothetical protein